MPGNQAAIDAHRFEQILLIDFFCFRLKGGHVQVEQSPEEVCTKSYCCSLLKNRTAP